MTEKQAKFVASGDIVTEPSLKDESKSPQFSAKAKGIEGYVGSGWINEGKFGKYINVKLRVALPAGSTIYLSPTKRVGKILG